FSSTEEYDRVVADWRKPFEDMHVVLTSKKQMEFMHSSIDHKIIIHSNFDDIVKAGLSKIATVMANEKY
ncbi:MAG TPA: hypothetical protein VK654_16995, partial [Nitrospirota bacterium]|nr:hypothetical protein [Nitrospirota bacterium]